MGEAAKKRTLHDIATDFELLLMHIEADAGEVNDELLSELDNCEEELTEKVDRCLLMAEKFFAQADAYDLRAKALARHAKALKNQCTSLRNLVLHNMERLGVTRLKTAHYPTIYISKNSRLEIPRESLFVAHFENDEDKNFVSREPKISKTEIKNWIKAGGDAKELEPFVTVVETRSLVVR